MAIGEDARVKALGCAIVGDGLAVTVEVAQDRDAIAHRVNLIEKMRHKHDAQPFRTQAAHHLEKLSDFLLVKTRGGLVEHEEPRVEIERARDRDHLLHRDRERPEFDIDVHIKLQPGERRAGVTAQRAPVHKTKFPRLSAEPDVLRNRERGDEIHFLVNGADARALRVLRRSGRKSRAGERNRARIGRIHAGEDLDQRRFARAVFTEERVDLARTHREIDAA